MIRNIWFISWYCVLFVCSFVGKANSDEIPYSSYKIINTYTHNVESLTEGLVYDNTTGFLLEASGGIEDCTIYVSNLLKVLDTINVCLDKKEEYFGTGITLLNNTIYQMTWESNKGFIYQKSPLKVIEEFPYSGKEAWGLTTDGTFLIVSNGSNIISFLNPSDFKLNRTITVMVNSTPYDSGPERHHGINELEYIKGEIWASIWNTFEIVRINPINGEIKSKLNLTGLYNVLDEEDTLNGIAYNPVSNTIYITGRRWSKLFELAIEDIWLPSTQSIVVTSGSPNPKHEDTGNSDASQAIVLLMVILAKGMALFTTYFKRL